MAWVQATGDVLTVFYTSGTTTYKANPQAWSTSTIRVDGSGSGSDYYYMFGVSLTIIESAVQSLSDASTVDLAVAVDYPDTEDAADDTDGWKWLKYIQSSPDSIEFLLDATATTMYATNVPIRWRGDLSADDNRLARTLDYSSGTAEFDASSDVSPAYIVYKDPAVVDLSTGTARFKSHRGRLMLMVRARINGDSPSSNQVSQPTGSVADLVAWWAPHNDPGFQGSRVLGPFWLCPSTDIIPFQDDVRLWIGTSGGVLMQEGLKEYLYLYCTVETAEYAISGATTPTGFTPGTYVRKIDIDDLLSALEMERAVPGTYTDESAWDDLTRDQEIAGENLGRIDILMTAGEYRPATDPSLELAEGMRAVDPVPILCADGTLVLFFALIGGTENEVWRAVALSEDVGPWPCVFGVLPGRDRLMRDRAVTDPDPVWLADGSISVFVGVQSVCNRFDGTETDACVDIPEWTEPTVSASHGSPWWFRGHRLPFSGWP